MKHVYTVVANNIVYAVAYKGRKVLVDILNTLKEPKQYKKIYFSNYAYIKFNSIIYLGEQNQVMRARALINFNIRSKFGIEHSELIDIVKQFTELDIYIKTDIDHIFNIVTGEYLENQFDDDSQIDIPQDATTIIGCLPVIQNKQKLVEDKILAHYVTLYNNSLQ